MRSGGSDLEKSKSRPWKQSSTVQAALQRSVEGFRVGVALGERHGVLVFRYGRVLVTLTLRNVAGIAVVFGSPLVFSALKRASSWAKRSSARAVSMFAASTNGHGRAVVRRGTRSGTSVGDTRRLEHERVGLDEPASPGCRLRWAFDVALDRVPRPRSPARLFRRRRGSRRCRRLARWRRRAIGDGSGAVAAAEVEHLEALRDPEPINQRLATAAHTRPRCA